MRAVNLIPEDARRGGGAGGIGRSGGAVYVVLGGLAVLVALVAAWALTGRTVSRDRAELDTLHAQIAEMRARIPAKPAEQTQGPSAQERLAAVRSLVLTRTDWALTLDAVARTLPSATSLTALTASTVPGGAAGGTGGAGAIASTSAGPSLQISGCSPSQKAVAKLMPRLRVVPGVQHVTLVQSAVADTSAGGSSSGGCPGVSFQMVLFLASAAPVPAAAPAATPAPSSTGAGQ